MGLDAYVRIPVITEDSDAVQSKELWYGRKENEIHGWMQRESGVQEEEFNCKDLTLTKEVLLKFEQDCSAGEMGHTVGFFFGSAGRVEDVAENVREILVAARQAIDEGNEVRYTSWW